MELIYRSAGLCLLFACGSAIARQVSWEELIDRSETLFGQAKFAEAETALLSALQAAEVFTAPDRRVAETQHRLGTVYRELGRLPEAEKCYQRALFAWQATEPGLPKPLISLSSLYTENGLHNRAERLLRPWLKKPLDEADPLSVNLLHSFAALQYARGRYSEAESLYRLVLNATESRFGTKSYEVAFVLNNLSMVLVKAGRNKEVGSLLERALAIWESVLAPDHPHVARALANLAAFHSSTGSYPAAEPLFHRALGIAESRLGPESPLVGQILTEHAILLRKTKRKNEARVLETRARAIRQSHAPEELGRHIVDFRDLLTPRR